MLYFHQPCSRATAAPPACPGSLTTGKAFITGLRGVRRACYLAATLQPEMFST